MTTGAFVYYAKIGKKEENRKKTRFFREAAANFACCAIKASSSVSHKASTVIYRSGNCGVLLQS